MFAVLSWLIHRQVAKMIARLEAMFDAWHAGTLILPPVMPAAERHNAPRPNTTHSQCPRAPRAAATRPYHDSRADAPESLAASPILVREFAVFPRLRESHQPRPLAPFWRATPPIRAPATSPEKNLADRRRPFTP